MPTTVKSVDWVSSAGLAEQLLDRLPGAPGGDPHLLVVVAGRPAGGEGVVQPEAVLLGDRVGQVGEGGGALVGRHHQVGVVVVVADHVGRGDDLAVDPVVGDVEQPPHHRRVAGHHLVHQRLAAALGRWLLDHEAALGPHRHDHGVLDHLGLHQAEDLGAEVLPPVRPADPAPGHLAAAQVDGLGAGRVHEHLEHGPGLGQRRHLGRVELERQVRLGLAVLARLEVVGPQGGLDHARGSCAGSGPRPGWPPGRSTRPAAPAAPPPWPRRPRAGSGRSGPGTAPPASGRCGGCWPGPAPCTPG